MFRRSFLATVLAAPMLLGGCVQEIKQDRVKVALMNAGLSEPLSGCMSHRMAEKLTIAQLHRLEALGGDKRSYSDYIDAVRRVHDPDALEVLISSAAMCKAGLIH